MNENQINLKKNNPTLVLLNKPRGMTSYDCIRNLKKHWNNPHLGHGGTLDSFAEGLLPLLMHEGLKCSRFFLENYPMLPTYWKTYEASMELGKQTDTDDPTGEIIDQKITKKFSEMEMKKIETFFHGKTYEQFPPKYSAKKINGQRASDLMRKDQDVELKSSSVTIQNFRIKRYHHPYLDFTVTCSKGTYIRSLAKDISWQLNTIGVLTDLIRTAIGNLKLENAFTLEHCLSTSLNSVALPLSDLLTGIPKVSCDQEEKIQIRNGICTDFKVKIANSGMKPSILVAQFEDSPIALFELKADKSVNFLRGFNQS